ncbi:hypothetical protein LOK49_LG09G01472 [Camellia lanceoleosa]|uniref:Uncharacterized protein n=1 Tax=Camellia lanceoleosa TaxID=1840588 RepID=A0ACC0GI77_9ERIC|nr:hypothetical protein LOK49_LG09G01472 [Camellia lanceoleosa]
MCRWRGLGRFSRSLIDGEKLYGTSTVTGGQSSQSFLKSLESTPQEDMSRACDPPRREKTMAKNTRKPSNFLMNTTEHRRRPPRCLDPRPDSPIPAAASAAVVPFVPPRLNSSDSVRVNGFSSVGEKERLGCLIGVGNGRLGTIVGENKKGEEDVSETLEARF